MTHQTRCEVTEWHPGIGGVDGLPGDPGFEVACENVSVGQVRFAYSFGVTEVVDMCEEHLLRHRDLPTVPGTDDIDMASCFQEI